MPSVYSPTGGELFDRQHVLAQGAIQLRQQRRRSTKPRLMPVPSHTRAAGLPFQTGTSLMEPPLQNQS